MSSNKPSRKYQGLSQEEWRSRIRYGYERGVKVRIIAQELGSTFGSIKVQAHRMGLIHPSGHGRKPLPAEGG